MMGSSLSLYHFKANVKMLHTKVQKKLFCSMLMLRRPDRFLLLCICRYGYWSTFLIDKKLKTKIVFSKWSERKSQRYWTAYLQTPWRTCSDCHLDLVCLAKPHRPITNKVARSLNCAPPILLNHRPTRVTVTKLPVDPHTHFLAMPAVRLTPWLYT